MRCLYKVVVVVISLEDISPVRNKYWTTLGKQTLVVLSIKNICQQNYFTCKGLCSENLFFPSAASLRHDEAVRFDLLVSGR